jgi:hypothetical protein
MAKTLGLACVLLLVLSVEAAARCSVPRITTFENQTVDGHMQADSGRPCRIRFLSSTGPMQGVDIVQRPSHGTVQVGEVNSIIYTSQAGYVGSDSFTYARRGLTTRGSPAVRTVRVAVTVTR